MKKQLEGLLYEYLKENNPDLFVLLDEADALHAFVLAEIEEVSHLVTIEECMDAMTVELRPSKYLYIKNILEDEFPFDYQQLSDCGILKYEVINMVAACDPVFDEFPLTEESEVYEHLKFEVMGVMSDYLAGE